MGELKLDALNKQQKQAIIAPLKPCLVLAGAGTGKTTILVKRFKHLVTQEKILADEIVITKFTNRASREIKKKIFEEFNKDAEFMKKVKVFTFDKFCQYILETEGIDFDICNDSKAIEYVRDNYLSLQIDAKDIVKLIWEAKWLENVNQKPVTYRDLVNFKPKFKREIEENFEEFRRVWKEYDNF